ncbi:TrbG/VirB9 family P-type conjugative transfer protein [Paraburkholderia susongensis]|uniref:Type IV secretion system protein VirB9 n=1 Tax=Paraburkholderia susongensis TaxID=1515439 RepID=A0A1X7M684_9BURK|nr:TrbG/VirB9 family P-type conjugative transfer protein [Paraburkholderia susongensis]SMG61561.1 type IV secretion system protein VirB9 [Paraburkholderia susongensis]
MSRLSMMVALAVAASPAVAHVIPGPCGTDEHIQCAIYDQNEVYEVATASGKAAMIQLEPGEFIEDKGAGMGDGKAWDAGSNKNWILIKPTQVRPDTNLMIATNRRTYTFSLVTAKRGQPTTWVLRFDYPDTRAKEAADAAKKRTLADSIGKSASALSLHRNDAYSKRGDDALAPTAVWDDGLFTYFRYATGRDLPRIFTILPDGAEALANYHMDGDTVVVHEVSSQFVIRLGNSVMGIRNDGYSPDGMYNAGGSTVPGMVRITKEQGK